MHHLSQCRLDYKQCYVAHRQNATPQSLTEYIDAHNAYVQQLHATNAMLETYQCETVPQLMQELEDIHNDLCSIIADSIQQGADVIANKVSTFHRLTDPQTGSPPSMTDRLTDAYVYPLGLSFFRLVNQYRSADGFGPERFMTFSIFNTRSVGTSKYRFSEVRLPICR